VVIAARQDRAPLTARRRAFSLGTRLRLLPRRIENVGDDSPAAQDYRLVYEGLSREVTSEKIVEQISMPAGALALGRETLREGFPPILGIGHFSPGLPRSATWDLHPQQSHPEGLDRDENILCATHRPRPSH